MGGNLAWAEGHSYTYDAENRLVSVDNGATASYKYDHQNRRVSKTVGSITTHYVWQGSQVIAEHDPATPLPPWWEPPYQVQSARVDYVYAGARMVYSTQRTSSTGGWTVRYYLSDRLSTRLVLDSLGNVIGRQGHLPFGENFAESGTQEKHHFTSYERDGESGTDYALNRQYGPAVGRFNRVDPSSGTAALPQSLNRYGYVTNNPVNAVDPLGLFPVINFPPICPVVNGVAVCGGLGSIDVSAGGNSGTLVGTGGSDGHGPFVAEDESASETVGEEESGGDQLKTGYPDVHGELITWLVKKALDILQSDNRKACRNLLSGTFGDSAKTLVEAWEGSRIRTTDLNDIARANLITQKIWLDEKQFFQDTTVGGTTTQFKDEPGSPVLTTEQAQVLTILHEVGHLTGLLPRHLTDDQSNNFDHEIYRACFK